MPLDKIAVRGARQHNLKNIDVDIPRNRLVVITGISGSGKSTLAFDTLYAEGQRRYVESLSAYARQFLEQMDKPDVDSIEGLAPAIAIEQKTITKHPRSTVGTITEIYDYLRLLFARIGKPHCHRCGQPITSQTTQEIVDQVMALEPGTKVMILSPVVAGQKGTHQKLFQRLRKDGFTRVRVDGKMFDLDEAVSLDKNTRHSIDVVVDRLIVKESARNRLADSIELAMGLSEGLVTVDLLQGEPLIFSEKAACMLCGSSYPPFTPASFSFNSPQGACPACDGLGAMMVFDPDLIVPDPTLSLRDGAIVPWENRHSVYFYQILDAITRQFHVSIYTPFNEFPEALKDLLLYGSKGETIPFYLERDGRRYTYSRPFEGVIPNLERRYRETRSHQVREGIEQFMNVRPCPECHGARLKPESLAVKVGGASIHEVCKRSVTALLDFFGAIPLDPRDRVIADPILKEITERLLFLTRVGLSYLTLDRASATLSSGEAQRIRLATQIGSKLTGVLYVLDEPSIGLHQQDHKRLLNTLKQMRDLGNTVVVVEHDAETILSADHVIDMGPGAGVHGGHLLFNGPPEDLLKHGTSLTGQYLSGRKTIPIPQNRRPLKNGYIVLEGVSANNLKDITVRFPLGCFVCVTGVSGSGKSTLVIETLYRSLAHHLYHARKAAGKYRRLTGLEKIDRVINIDQSPIGRTPRSNPVTYTGTFTHMRDLFTRTPEARVRGYKPGRFSFNMKGGRCEACRGNGIIKIEMHFLPNVYVTCDVCRGKRYNRETLDVRYKGVNISEVLDMTVNQAIDFFSKIKKIRTQLQTLADVGLGYIHLGQPATTLSGGEAQRVKLSRELGKRGTGKTVYILDEPTTGLHFADIQKLLDVLNRLADAGNTIIVIEHNMDVIKSADYIIDLGPEGGDKGGYLVGAGRPEEIARLPGSYTGQFLSKVLHSPPCREPVAQGI
ncbi:MAG: excinuclease ABC subunit UvrA [Deltaproteobacteria bacterium]|nr:excinuclease ABC subunit UvrA [Deltaproteobacteria bacterium]MBW2073214.1 excinuclease ABC subunit UvrA [Deltaproteobacteria bacterium]